MTRDAFENNFAGRVELTRVLRHVRQSGLVYDGGSALRFRDEAAHEAYLLVELRLRELEQEFKRLKRAARARKAAA